MNDSTDNTNELDSYGVWVKHQPGADTDTTQSEGVASADSLNIDDAFDLPDFPETEESVADGIDFDSVFENESTDTIDVLNPDFDIPVEDTLDIPSNDDEPETTDDSFDLPDMPDESDFEISSETSVEVPAEDSFDVPTEESVEVPSEDSFDIPTEDAQTDTPAEESVEIDTSDFELPTEDGEISLDDFGFDDSSSGGGDDFQLPTEDGEISLDDFGFEDSSSSEKTVEIVDEQPLDMNISFDPDVDSVETEDNVQTENTEMTEEEAYKAAEAEVQSEEIDMSEFDTSSTNISSDATEEVDLSDFGIDADAEETPITQNVEESKMKDTVVDYDLSVSDENMASAPVVNEIKDSEKPTEETSAPTEEETPVSPAPAVATSTVSESLLQQIVADLSDLKNEINSLKSNLEDIKTNEQSQTSEEPIIPENTEEDSGGFFDDTDGDDTIALSGNELDNIMNSAEFSEATSEEGDSPSNTPDEDFTFADTSSEGDSFGATESEESITTEEPVINDTLDEEPIFEETAIDESEIEIPSNDEITIPENTEEDSGGFFDDTDGDDTIALSGNELDNIMNNAEFSETVVEETQEEESATEETFDNSVFDSTFEETTEESDTDGIPTEIEIEPVPTENIQDDITDDTSEITETVTTTEQTDFVENDIFGSVSESDDDFIVDDTDDYEETSEGIIDSEEALEEPNLDDIVIENEIEDEELPDEISIPKVDDILVESSNVDFMNSVQDSTPEAPMEEPAANETIDDFDDFIQTEAPVNDEILSDDHLNYLNEEVPDEMPVETSEIKETPVEEAPVDNETSGDDDESFATVDNMFATAATAAVATAAAATVLAASSTDDNNDDSFASVDAIAEQEPTFEETSVNETEVFDTTETEQAVDETVTEETTTEEPVLDNTNQDIQTPANDTENDNLKQDIKSVLLYMDQLLENLPEEKIVEFAKSEEFGTYKKLFSELGLS